MVSLFAALPKPVQSSQRPIGGSPISATYDVRPALPALRLQKQQVDARVESYLSEYATLANDVGIAPPDLAIESFKALLARLDIPIFSLQEVIAYMDAKAAKESKEKAGWEWRALRAKDQVENVEFGHPASRNWSNNGTMTTISPASDYYKGPTWYTPEQQHGGWASVSVSQESQTVPPTPYERLKNGGRIDANGHSQFKNEASSRPYELTIPLHALRRIAKIEKEHKSPVAFFVSDYALAPQITHPDPFLMAVIPNSHLQNGIGRFIIDFWDEPGFGIEQMLK